MLAPSTVPKISITISPLQLMKIGEEGRIYRLRGSEAVCAQLQQMGLTVGTYLQVVQRHPAWILLLPNGQLSLPAYLAKPIWVCMDPCCTLAPPQEPNKKTILNLPRAF
ncbi:MAG TPA: ferrous iron transport protein A [Synechococcus sp. M44_DOE_062]|nr:ferrous iron transport protein A [Synechococcus sp. M44_DOE_062]